MTAKLSFENSPGPQVAGYQELSILAAGASSTVYQARPDQGGEVVAIKILASSVGSENEYLAFEREIEAMARLAHHPYVVSLLDSGLTTDFHPYIVMPLYRNGTWGGLVERSGPLDWKRLCDFGIKSASALESLHRSGFVHRDIKPANIYVSENLQDPVLADFGISSFIAPRLDGPLTVKISATPIYAAPEVLGGHRPNTSSDIYSLGATMFGLIEGSPAFADPLMDVVVARVTSDDPVPRISAGNAPEPLIALVASMMSKDPEQRPRTAYEVAVALQQLQQARSVPETQLVIYDVDPIDGPDPLGQPGPAVTVFADQRPVRTGEPASDYWPVPASDGFSRGHEGDPETAPELRDSLEGLLDPGPFSGSFQPSPESVSLTDQPTVTVRNLNAPTLTLSDVPTLAAPTSGFARPSIKAAAIAAVVTLSVLTVGWLISEYLFEDSNQEVVPVADSARSIWVRGASPAQSWAGHLDSVDAVAFNEDGTILATGGRDQTLKTWAVTSATAAAPAAPPEPASPESTEEEASGGETAGSGGGVEPLSSQTLDSWPLSLGWSSAASNTLAVAGSDGTVLVLWPNRAEADASAPVLFAGASGSAEALAWRPQSSPETVAVGGEDQVITIWRTDTTGAEDQQRLGASTTVLSMDWNRAGSALAYGGKSSTAHVWDATTEQVTSSLSDHGDWVRGVAWSPDGRLATADSEGEVRIWDLELNGVGQPGVVKQFSVGSDPVGGIDWSPDGKALAVGGENGTLTVWTLPDEEKRELNLSSAVVAVSFSPDGTMLAVGLADGTVTLLEPKP